MITPTPISGDCCVNFGSRVEYGSNPFDLILQVQDKINVDRSLRYSVNFGDGNVIRDQELLWDHDLGYSIKLNHSYTNLGNYNAFVFVENLNFND